MINGAFGLIATGLFASPARLEVAFGNSNHVGFFYSFAHGGADATLLAAQIICILFIFGWVMFTMLPFFVWLDMKGWFRSDPLDEIIGLDTSYHGGCVLGANTEKIGPEYIAAMEKRKEENKNNKLNRSRHKSVDLDSSRGFSVDFENSRHKSVNLEDIEEEVRDGQDAHEYSAGNE